MHQNRYAVDRPEMRDYCRNYLVEVDQKTFNLKNHSKYLDIILSKPGITQDVVFTVEGGWAYFAKKCRRGTGVFHQKMLSPSRPVQPGCADAPACGTWLQTVSGQGGRGYRLRYGNRGSSQWPKYCQQRSRWLWSYVSDGDLGFTHRKSAAAVPQDVS